jgi:hypothetical protein
LPSGTELKEFVPSGYQTPDVPFHVHPLMPASVKLPRDRAGSSKPQLMIPAFTDAADAQATKETKLR